MSAARRDRLAGVGLLLAVAVIGFLWMPAEFLDGDPHTWREETRSLLLTGELNVPADFASRIGDPGQYFTRNERNGLYYSKYGVANALLSLPPMWLEKRLGGPVADRLEHPSLLLFNFWHLLLGLALAALLYRLSAGYSRRVAVRVLFVFCAFYCTSLWFYQRAQSSEIYQTILFTALFMSAIGFLRRLQQHGPRGLDARAWACLAAVWACAALLVLTRVVYGLLLPTFCLLAAYFARGGGQQRTWRDVTPLLYAALLVPPALIVVLLGWVNQVKFGAPWLTGYHQWRTELVALNGRPFDGLWGYLFSARFSIFLHFPLLLFALLGLRGFVQRHRLDAVVMLSLFAVFLLLLSCIPSWAGEWAYGPRYLLPMLPMLSLPFLVFADDVIDRIGTRPARAWGAVAVAVLAYSAYLQVQINRMPFFTYYHARAAAKSEESIDYFYNHHHAVVVSDLIRHRANLEGLAYYAELKRDAPEVFAFRRAFILSMLERGNLYWALPPQERRLPRRDIGPRR